MLNKIKFRSPRFPPKHFRNSVLLLTVLGWIVIFGQWFSYQGNQLKGYTDEEILSQELSDTAEVERFNLEQDDILQVILKHLDVHDVPKPRDMHSTVYDRILQNHKLGSVLGDLSYDERCNLFFSNIYASDLDWFVDPEFWFPSHSGTGFTLDFDDFKSQKKQEVREIIANDKRISPDAVDDEELENRLMVRYKFALARVTANEQKAADYISLVRNFNRCYLSSISKVQSTSDEEFVKKQSKFINSFHSSEEQTGKLEPFTPTLEESYIGHNIKLNRRELETRIYRWMSLTYPLYERWNGEKLFSPPVMSNYIKDKTVLKSSSKDHEKFGKIKSSKDSHEKCFLQNFRENINGKGLVLTISDSHVDDAVRLIHVLRALNNKYPIQFVSYDGLSPTSKKRLIHAAREIFADLPKSFEKVHQYFPDNYLDDKTGGLPKQEIWFVNVRNVIRSNYRFKFGGYSNKFLAAMFNSFAEYILLDADSVPVQNPEYFFNLPGYKEKGAFFYKDRKAFVFRADEDGDLFKILAPTAVDYAMFNIPLMSDEHLKIPFFEGMYHQMESGLVVINRNLHFSSTLMMIHLNFFHSVTEKLHGDKELFWLGFLINGDNDFVFNSLDAAAIGDEKAMIRPDTNEKTRAHRVCSTHPGHIDGYDNQTLLWFNSGYKVCGKPLVKSWQDEFEKNTLFPEIKLPEELKTFYESPFKIKKAVVPPFLGKLHCFFPNPDHEPDKAWIMEEQCGGYIWCAHSFLGKLEDEEAQLQGRTGIYVEFDQKSQDLYSYFGDIWMGAE
ncbi:Piso0_000464 [Millerozyma farinosa CBS 7064]|uniref:Piso0_000464 protein n=1 Tax=Pichia sorbitophila (strain ATCC MYA-4447 / BCRC 22081 / CBS 7064 / NBRC 10061 / NRRL Y-12695) TaxID=559304 RepID=G8YU23_PICSO|nr:Piso0_000464 [Millerozyma farinosa CBS 7064]CCE73424.1 Piso0_000464 [Millerozyma farinosa CBS 7064]